MIRSTTQVLGLDNDMPADVARILHKLNVGVFDPVGSTGNILVEPRGLTSRIGKILLFQQPGLGMDSIYYGEVRNPILHVEYSNTLRGNSLSKMYEVIKALDQKNFFSNACTYWFKATTSPAPIKESDGEVKCAVNFIVKQVVKV